MKEMLRRGRIDPVEARELGCIEIIKAKTQLVGLLQGLMLENTNLQHRYISWYFTSALQSIMDGTSEVQYHRLTVLAPQTAQSLPNDSSTVLYTVNSWVGMVGLDVDALPPQPAMSGQAVSRSNENS